MNTSVSKTVSAVGAVAVTAAAVMSAAAYITSKLLVQTALDRKLPGIMKRVNLRVSGSVKDEKFGLDCAEASDRLKGLSLEEVCICAADGTRLAGHFYPCDNPKRVIIAFHGWRSSWHYDYGMIADFWHSSGCSVLYAEQRGQNGSGGEHMGFGLTERFDCVSWTEWANERFGKDMPIYLAGISMGAATVLMASDLEMPENLCGIMADCGFTSPKAIWEHVAKNNLHISYCVRGMIADALCRKKIRMGSGEYSAADALRRTKIPVLFIHGTDDRFVPVEMTYENYKACASPKRLLVVPGADHAMSAYVNRKEYEKAMTDFWHDFDGKAAE